MARAIFLDRDGVVNQNVWYESSQEWESPRSAEDFALHYGVLDALAALRSDDWKLVVVSNQPSFAKGKTTLEALRQVHARLEATLSVRHIALDAAYYCFHHPAGVVPEWSGPCVCRKPSPHFLHLAAKDLGLDLERSWMIGDRASDVECGTRAGVRTILVEPDHPGSIYAGSEPTHRARDLAGAAQRILAEEVGPL
jgi:D-glycero-D-manno-heptose 1,7-bisphosphate phosphatase